MLASLAGKRSTGKTLIELQEICKSCGLSATGNKTELFRRIQSNATPLPTEPWSIVSLDIGVHNFAKAVINIDLKNTPSPTLIGWEKLETFAESFKNPRDCALSLKLLCDKHIKPVNVNQSNTCYLIERQTFRGGGTRMIPGYVQIINRIETQLHCFLLDEKVYTIDPRSVAMVFGMGTGRKKKKDAVIIADKLVYNKGHDSIPSAISISETMREFYIQQEKKDDLADALLQAIAYYQWRINLAKLHESISLSANQDVI